MFSNFVLVWPENSGLMGNLNKRNESVFLFQDKQAFG